MEMNLDDSPVQVVEENHDEVFSTATSLPRVQLSTPTHISGSLGKRSSHMSGSRGRKRQATNKNEAMVKLVQAVQSVAEKLNSPACRSSIGYEGGQNQYGKAITILKKMFHEQHMSIKLYLFAVDLLRDNMNSEFFIDCDDAFRLPFIERKLDQYQKGANLDGLDTITMNGDDNRKVDQEWVARFIVVVSATAAAMHYYSQHEAYIDRVACRTSILQGSDWVEEILQGHPARCSQLFRMKKEIFRELCIDLRDKYMLPTTNTIQIPEMVGIFLFTLGQGANNRMLQECFQYSDETISQIFKEVLHSVYLMSMDFIKPRDNQFDTVPARIRNDPKYSPFRDCIGVIDGTHIPAVIPKDERGRFIGRNGFTTQNVMAACDFDMLYIFVSAGWEGSAHDTLVFQDAITVESLHFPHPPPGKYYLVDAGYPNRIGYLAPYRGERYHSSQFENGHRASGPQEVFNHAHLSLRNVIERTFGVTKNRWPILRNMQSFPFLIQVEIVISCMALHNFIRLRVTNDDEFTNIDEGPSCSYEESPIDAVTAGDSDLRDDNTMMHVRDLIANKLVRQRDRT